MMDTVDFYIAELQLAYDAMRSGDGQIEAVRNTLLKLKDELEARLDLLAKQRASIREAGP